MTNLEAVPTLELTHNLRAAIDFTKLKGQAKLTPTRMFTMKRKIRELELELASRAA